MSMTKRQEEILSLINDQGFLTVDRLAELTYTSPSSVRRDLARLQELSLIRRTHGGASAFHTLEQALSLSSRMTRNIAEKRKIAKKASALLHDGQSVMLDGSTTAGFMVPFIAAHQNMVLFTNNMLTAVNAVNYGIRTHCIGGATVNGSAVLSGEQAYLAIERLRPDILFFSSGSLNRDGEISDPISEENHIRSLMLKSAKQRVFLCDSDKFDTTALYYLTSLSQIDVCVYDKPWEDLRVHCAIEL